MRLTNSLAKNSVLAPAVFLLSLVFYVITLCPTVFYGDSGEFIASAQILGINHPSGYPLHSLIGKLFTWLPINSVAFRLNLMSAFFAAASVAILFLILRRLKVNKVIAFFVPLIFALTTTLWSQSIVAEVYTLNLFLFALALYFLLAWKDGQKNKFLYWLFFVLGLSLTNHFYLTLIVLPGFLIALFLIDRKWWKNKKVLIAGLLFLLGLSVYLYLPIRSLSNPAIDFGNPENISGIWNTLSRSYYSDFSFTSFSLNDKLIMLHAWADLLLDNFTFLLVGVGLFGLAWSFFSDKKIFFTFLLIFLLGSIGLILFRQYRWGFRLIEMYKSYYLPCFYIFAVWLGLGFSYLWQKLSANLPKKIYATSFLVLVLLFTPILLFINNYQENDLSNYYLEHDFTYNLLNSLDQNAILVLCENDMNIDNILFGLLYWQLAEGLRQDVQIEVPLGIDPQGNFAQFTGDLYQQEDYLKADFASQRAMILETVAEQYLGQRPIYTSYVYDGQYSTRTNGYAYQVFGNESEADNHHFAQFTPLRNITEEIPFLDYVSQDLLAKYYYNMANWYLENEDIDQSGKYLIKAIKQDNEPYSADFNAYTKHRGIINK